jgi:hypothetical protein
VKRSIGLLALALLVAFAMVSCSNVMQGSTLPKLTKLECINSPELSGTVSQDLPTTITARNGDNDADLPALLAKSAKSVKAQKSAEAFRSSRAPRAYNMWIARRTQETGYWCGPASVQMLQYYFGQPCSQQAIANGCGTTSSYGTSVSAIVGWLDDYPMTGYMYLPSWFVWEAKSCYNEGWQGFLQDMYSSCGNWGSGQIWNLCTYPSNSCHLPGYNFNGQHYVVGSGYDLDAQTVLEDDPWYGVAGSDVWIHASVALGCVNANYGLIIY